MGFGGVGLVIGCLCFTVVGGCVAMISRKFDGCIVVIAGIVVLELLFGCCFVCCGLWVVGVLVALLVVFDCLSSLVVVSALLFVVVDCLLVVC